LCVFKILPAALIESYSHLAYIGSAENTQRENAGRENKRYDCNL